ncbi:transcription factor bHLH94-like [Typha latifolia]|uniref:transcription factor bHLH94-like n=1 Tax=Typha latifolia TaxID=4733 RepID=UPI003C2AF0DB
MALEAVVFPQDLFGFTMKEFCGFGALEEEEKEVAVECEVGCEQGAKRKEYGVDWNWDASCSSMVQKFEEWDGNSPTPEAIQETVAGRRKRRRTKSAKNKEEVENQRMTHIAVERNRRKQMNEYLAVLRSLMPASYAQRGDQASIIGGAINFVKELEQLLQSLEAQKRLKQRSDAAPFTGFFAFPQYSSCTNRSANAATTAMTEEAATEDKSSAAADVEVTVVESHANVKVLSRRQPKQLVKIVAGLQNLRLTTLHLNVTTVEQMVLYSLSLKVEDDCRLSSVDDIATAVYQMIGRIGEEPTCK